jgi:protein involved in polysaccharide export with SLBB domain
MNARTMLSRPAQCLAIAIALGASPMADAAGQQNGDGVPVDRPLATRSELETLARQLQSSDAEALARVKARLAEGDFRPGDLVWIQVQNEETLSDTFEIGPDRELRLPAPTVGTLPLKGVLRSELDEHVQEYISKFVRDPVARARPLMRISIQGEVAQAGYHALPADAVLADALTAAGGATAEADMRKLRIERNGEKIWKGKELQEAIANRGTIDQMGLQDGDRLIIDRRNAGFQENLRFMYLVVALAGGVYGLSRAF